MCHTYPDADGKSCRLTTHVDVREDLRADLFGGAACMYEEASDVLLLSLIKLAQKLGLSSELLPELPDDVDPDESGPLFQPWRTEAPTPRTRPEKTGFFAGIRMQYDEHAITRCYEARHKLHMGDFSTVEEYRDLRDDVDEGLYVLERWTLGGELTLRGIRTTTESKRYGGPESNALWRLSA